MENTLTPAFNFSCQTVPVVKASHVYVSYRDSNVHRIVYFLTAFSSALQEYKIILVQGKDTLTFVQVEVSTRLPAGISVTVVMVTHF